MQHNVIYMFIGIKLSTETAAPHTSITPLFFTHPIVISSLSTVISIVVPMFSFSIFGAVQRGVHGVVSEVLVFCLHQVMLRRHQGLVLDHCKNKHRHKYKNTWIIAQAMSRRRKILLVFMALSIGCYCHFITFSWKITAL